MKKFQTPLFFIILASIVISGINDWSNDYNKSSLNHSGIFLNNTYLPPSSDSAAIPKPADSLDSVDEDYFEDRSHG